jgi:hypothetical protein
VEERRAAIIGWVYAPFRMNDLMRGLGGEHASDLEVEIYDGKRPTKRPCCTARPAPSPLGRARRCSRTPAIAPPAAPGPWSVRSAPQLRGQARQASRAVIAVTGVGLGLLLSLVVWLLATERRRALQLAGGMTLELRESRDRIDAERQRIRLILQNAYDAFLAIGPTAASPTGTPRPPSCSAGRRKKRWDAKSSS